jgi:ubiquinone/menaquinone biosynthesis C-methylase UbiE
MTIFDSLTLAEQARQLRNPEGDIGLAVAEWLNKTNRQGNVRAVELLDLKPGNHVLEIGFGNGRTVADVVAQAAGVRYAGIDISPTMVAEAARFNAGLVAAGRASFHLGSAESMAFADASFDRVFSTGVSHFWAAPAGPLAGVCRVLRRGGISQMACLHPRSAPAFARPEHGFYLRDDASWHALHRAAGFSEISVQTLEFEQANRDGTPVKRYGIIVVARS